VDIEGKVLEVLKQAEKPLRPGDIATRSGLDKEEVSKAIQKLKASGLIYSPVRCAYAVVKK